MTPVLSYRTSTLANALPYGRPNTVYLLPQESAIQFAAYAFDQEYQMDLLSFPPAPKNTPSNAATLGLTDANAILTNLTQPGTTGAGMGKFKARFCRVPASWDDVKTMPWQLPGFLGSIFGSNWRNPTSRNVNVRLHYDYFVVDPSNVAAGVLDSSGAAVTRVSSMTAIPIVNKTNFCITALDGTINYLAFVDTLVQAGGFNGLQEFYLPTFPTIETYKAWTAVAAPYAANGLWTQTTPPIWDGVTNANTYGQLVADDSNLEVYSGQIIARVTRYILAV
jgi:hypothetical protein